MSYQIPDTAKNDICDKHLLFYTSEQEPPIQRKRRCIDVGEVDREKNFQEKFIGKHFHTYLIEDIYSF